MNQRKGDEMKASRFFLLFSLLVLQSAGLGQNLLPNGDFENDFDGWVQIGTAAISNSVVQSGSKSLMASDTLRTVYSYVYQEFTFDYDQHEVNFWVYPASDTFFSAFELIANWMPNTGVIFITRVLFRESSISFTAVDRSETIQNVLVSNSWNQVTIRADKTNLTQDFFINGTLHSSLTPSSFPTIEHILVGDLSAFGMYGTLYFDEIFITESTATSVADPGPIPSEFVLEQNYPNPFNPSTTIAYQTTTPGPVVLKIYNIFGQEVRTLVNKMQLPGSYSIDWDGTGRDGQRVSSGVYVYRLNANGLEKARKMLVVK
ncbi:T9SS type A sorting domain-containing protein [bacterium]|nr:T9SS type A sorting domain-containing protein [bacterium]